MIGIGKVRNGLRYGLALVLGLACMAGGPRAGHAQTPPTLSLSQLAPAVPQFSATINVVCGDLQKTPCAIALPKMAHYATQSGLTMVPVSSGGSIATAQIGVCPGVVPVGIGMADGFDAVQRLPQCGTAFKVIGGPLFPFFGYLIVAATNPAHSLDDLVNTVAPGNTVNISDGAVGTGSQITFSNMLTANHSYKRVISEEAENAATSLKDVTSGKLDGYFVMDSPGSPLIAKVIGQVDAAGKPLFKFLDVRPGQDFYGLRGVDKQLLYQEVTIDPGIYGFGATKTVSTNGEIIVNTAWANNPANAQTIAILVQAQDQAEASILAASHSPGDWTGQHSTRN